MIVRGVPARLKGKIAKRVATRESNLNDVVAEVLCSAFDIPYEPSGRKSPAEIGPYPNLVLDVPAELKRRVEVEASTRGESIRNVVVEILADEFGEPFVPTGRWRGHVKRDRAATA